MRIEVIAGNDGLEARLRFHDFAAAEWKRLYGEPESLHSFLTEAGIAAEFIDKAGLQLLHGLIGGADGANAAEVLEEAQAVVIASGVPPMDDELVGMRLLKAYFTGDEELGQLKARLAGESFEAVVKNTNPGCLVNKGETILGFTGIKKGTAGVGVFGAPIPAKPYGSTLPKPGNSILEENNNWVALRRGILVVEDNTFKILGPHASDNHHVLIAPDKMSVRLILRKSDDDFKPTLDFLQQLIASKGFSAAADVGAMQSVLDAFLATGKDQDRIVISGKPCTKGTQGRLELLVDPEPVLPEPDKEGKIDFKAFSYFRTVKKGDTLGKLIAPVPGRVGLDVFGNPVMPEPVEAFGAALGRNTELTVSEPAFIVATCDGRLVLAEGGVPEVVETLQIAEDVSLKTGNINFPGSVEVVGDVRDNLEIKAKGDVDIAGVVEDGSIVSEGAIIVKGGFTGTGKGVIKSKLSSVSIGFIRNQRIESNSDIIVYNEVMNAQLNAKKSIVMKTMGHSVVGGHLVAYSGIEIFNAGNATGAKTILEVGKDFEVEMELMRKKSALKEVQADLEFLEKVSAKLQSLVRWGSDVKGDIRLLEQRSRGVLQILKPLKDSLVLAVKELEHKLYNPGDCHIWVRGEAFPGTILRYQERNLMVREVSRGKRWLFRGKPGAAAQKDKGFAEFV